MTLMNVFWFIGGACMGMLLGEMLAVVAFVKGRKKPMKNISTGLLQNN